MHEPRVAMKPKHRMVSDDVEARVAFDGPRYARTFELKVAEDALEKMGPMAIEVVVGELAKNIVYRRQDQITRVVDSYLNDRAWAEPIIRAEIARAVREVVREMLDADGSVTPRRHGDRNG